MPSMKPVQLEECYPPLAAASRVPASLPAGPNQVLFSDLGGICLVVSKSLPRAFHGWDPHSGPRDSHYLT